MVCGDKFLWFKKKKGGEGWRLPAQELFHMTEVTVSMWLMLQKYHFFCPIGSIEQPVTVKCIRFLTLSARQQLERMPRRQPEANKAPAGNANPTITNPESGLASSQTSSSSESQFLLAKWVRWFSLLGKGSCFKAIVSMEGINFYFDMGGSYKIMAVIRADVHITWINLYDGGYEK